MPDTKRDVDRILHHHKSLESERTIIDSLREQCARVAWPDADDFFSDRTPGEHRTRNLYDSTGATTLERAAGVLETLLTPRSRQWHKLRPSDKSLQKNSEVREFFENMTNVLFQIRSSPVAQFYSQKHVGYKSLLCFGDECLYTEELLGRNRGIRYENCHVDQVCIAEDHHRKVDTIYRKFPMSAHAAELMWGENPNATLPSSITNALKDDPFKTFDFLHVVMPNPDFDEEAGKFNPLKREFASLYIGLKDRSLIEESGFHENPYMYSRYTLNPNEKYGRSPTMLKLPSLNMLQEMTKTWIRAGHKVVDPPLLLPSDEYGGGSGDVFLHPGGLNPGAMTPDGKPLIAPLLTGADVPQIEEMLDRERASVDDVFFTSLNKAIVEHPNMTATQVLEIVKKEGQAIGPMIGRQQSEQLGPMVQREIAIGLRNGWFGDIPEILVEADGDYDIEYISEATQMQQAQNIQAIDRMIERGLALSEAAPEAMDAINITEAMRRTGEIDGVPEEVIASDEEIQAKQEQRAKELQQQQMLESAASMASTAKDVSAALPAQGA